MLHTMHVRHVENEINLPLCILLEKMISSNTIYIYELYTMYTYINNTVQNIDILYIFSQSLFYVWSIGAGYNRDLLDF